jgi:hypothetical protein
MEFAKAVSVMSNSICQVKRMFFGRKSCVYLITRWSFQYVRSRIRSGVNPSTWRAASELPPFSHSLRGRDSDSSFAESCVDVSGCLYTAFIAAIHSRPVMRTVVRSRTVIYAEGWSRVGPG